MRRSNGGFEEKLHESLGHSRALVLAILLAGGAITSNMLSSDLAIQQTTDPSGDFLTATPDQAVAFILVTGFIIFNVIGAGLTLLIRVLAAQPPGDRRPSRVQ